MALRKIHNVYYIYFRDVDGTQRTRSLKTTDKEISALGNDFNVYSSLLADAEKVYASDYGYNYFSLFEITDIDTSKDASYEISVIPYTTAGNNTVYGEEMILTIAIAGGEISIS